MNRTQLKRRDATQVAYHWVNFAAVTSLIVTGLAIYFGASGTAEYFMWHLWAAWVFLAALVVHVWHDTVTLKRFDRMWFTRQDLHHAIKRFRGALGSGTGPLPKHGHYKVEQIIFHWVLTLDLIGLVITGLIIWEPGRIYVAPFWMPWGWDAIFFARVLHQALTFLLLVLILAHVYFALLVRENRPELISIFTGRVPLAEYAEGHRISPRLEAHLRSEETGMQLEGGETVQKI